MNRRGHLWQRSTAEAQALLRERFLYDPQSCNEEQSRVFNRFNDQHKVGEQLRQPVNNIVCQTGIALCRSTRRRICGIGDPLPMNHWAVRDELQNFQLIGISQPAFANSFFQWQVSRTMIDQHNVDRF